MFQRAFDRFSTWISQANWSDPRMMGAVVALWFAAVVLLVWTMLPARRAEPRPNDDTEQIEQQPETDTLEMPAGEPGARFWARVRERWFGADPEGATVEATIFTNVPRRGRVSGDMDSLVDRADIHDQFRAIQVRFEEALDASLLDIAKRFGCYDEMIQALAPTHVHVPDSFELDDAAAPIIELLEADTMTWTIEDQAALDALLSEESVSR